MTDVQPWFVESDRLGGWWVTEGEWKPGHPDMVKGRFRQMTDALQTATDHNARIKRRGRPPLPLTKSVVRYAMVRADWKVTGAAEILGVNRRTLHRWLAVKMKEVGQNPPLKSHSGKTVTPSARKSELEDDLPGGNYPPQRP